jgi:hypothetical protein
LVLLEDSSDLFIGEFSPRSYPHLRLAPFTL